AERLRVLSFRDDSRRRLTDIVAPRQSAGQRRNDLFECRKETHLSQRPVQPSGGDAIVPAERGRVVGRMMIGRKDEVQALQSSNEEWRGGGMRPLVELIGRKNPEDQRAKQRRRKKTDLLPWLNRNKRTPPPSPKQG